MKITGTKFMVTGGAGFIGSHLCEELVNEGKQVVCVDNLVAGKEENLKDWWDDSSCVFLKKDICDLKHNDFEGVDVVFHNAASKCTVCRVDPFLDLKVNAWGSWNVFNEARKINAKVIHASTGSVCHGGSPKSFYGVSKLTAENYLKVLKEYYPSFKYTILRYYHVYGSRQENSNNGGVIPIFIRKAFEKKPMIIFGTGKQVRHFTFVKDVVNANFLAAESKETNGQTFDVVSDVKISISELASLVYELMNKPERIEFAPRKLGDIDTFITSNKEIKELGMVFQNNFREGLKETIAWYNKIRK